MQRRLEGATIVVLGATGNVGFGVVGAALDEGAAVVLPTRDEARAQELREAFAGRPAEVIVGDLSDPDDADRLAASLGSRRFDHAVASLGAWWQGGELVRQSAAEYERVRRMLLDGQVHAARVLLPRLRDAASSYTIVTGTGALQPLPGASLLTIATGGTLALSRVLRFEHRSGPRVNELRIGSRVERASRPGVVQALALGRAAVELMTSEVRGAVVPFESPDSFDVHANAEVPRR